MADIADLNLTASEPLSEEVYEVASKPRPFPNAGRYTLEAPASFDGDDTFGASRAGALTARIDPTIVAPEEYAGRELRYTRISDKVFTRGAGKASQFGDYLKACGFSVGLLDGNPTNHQAAVLGTAGTQFEAQVDWRLFARGEGPDGEDLVIEGQRVNEKRSNGTWETDEAGNPVPYVVSKHQVDDDGNPKRLWANLTITRFYPKA